MLLSLLSLLCSQGFAADPTVLVSHFQARSNDAVALASSLEGYLAQELGKTDGIVLKRIDEMPRFEDYTARIYLEGCPLGEIVGCTYIVAERGKVDWAVTGTVRATASGAEVSVSVISVTTGRTVVTLEKDLADGTDEAFAEGVAKMLVAATLGGFQEQDIRGDLGAAEKEANLREMSKEQAAAQLEELSKELGDVTIAESGEIERPEFTMDDLSEEMEGEGTKPWERLDMTPGEYLKFKNSGMQIYEWRQRAVGRQGQLLIRGSLGFGRGPYDDYYYGRYAYGDGSTTVVDAYSAYAVQNASGVLGGGGLAYGVLPILDVGVDFYAATGKYRIFIDQENEGEENLLTGNEEETLQSSNLLFGPRVTATLLPTSNIRPSLGAAVLFLKSEAVDQVKVPPAVLTYFPAPLLVLAEATVGGEARLNDNLDFYLQVPIDILVGGDAEGAVRNASTEVLGDLNTPVAAGPIGAGVRVGFQVRLGGKKVEEERYVEEE